MNRTKTSLIASFIVAMLVAGNASAAVKVDKAALAKLEKIAVVSVAFRYNENRELWDDDPETIMINEAEGNILAELSKGGSFEVVPTADVVGHPQYESLTEDSGFLDKNMNHYPHGYRKLKLTKKNAGLLANTFGADAVLLLKFTNSITESGNFIKKTNSFVLTGEITLIDKDGNTVISGKAKSRPQVTGTSWGGPGGTEFEQDKKSPEFFSELMASFMKDLQNDLKFK